MSTPATPSTNPSSGPVPQQQPATSYAEIRALAMQLTAMSSGPPPLTLDQGVVADISPASVPPTCSITLAGSGTQVDDVRYLSSYTPVIGDTIAVLRQNGSPLVVGHTADIGTATASSGGWQEPSALSSGWTTNGNSNGPVMFRLFLEGGVFKVQWKGSIAHSSSTTEIMAPGVIPEQFRPTNAVNILAHRDQAGGSVVIGLKFLTDGSCIVQGPTTVPLNSSHTHGLGTSDTQLSGYNSQGGSDLGHAHGLGTSGSGGTVSVSHPTYISFNGVEYFL